MAFGAKGDLVFALKMSSNEDLKDHYDWLNLYLIFLSYMVELQEAEKPIFAIIDTL